MFMSFMLLHTGCECMIHYFVFIIFASIIPLWVSSANSYIYVNTETIEIIPPNI